MAIVCFFCNQLAIERKNIEGGQTASATKKKKRKHNKVTTDASDGVASNKANPAAESTNADFMPHDYGKANLTTLLQGSFIQ